ncbi:MAG: energy transducer TonB [Prevotellaceae bacterium]|jgi:TonB family protein|nr:energy transducer TonB [Prevotellaceae bacterium]
MDLFFEEKQTVAQRIKKHQIGIYLTVIVHLLVIIVLLISKINAVKDEDLSIMIDFSRETEKETEEKLLREKEKLAAEVEQLFKDARDGKIIRNVAVNTEDLLTSTLKDDKGINEKVYDEARQLQEKLDANRKKMEDLQTSRNEVPVYDNSQNSPSNTKSYEGASVITYTLEGWRAMYLPVPVYKCQQGGDVCVQIDVNQSGYVVKASVVSTVSASAECLHEAAVSAAKSSRFRFNASDAVPKLQTGTIIYRFVAQ